MVNRVFKLISPSLQKKYRCDAFIVKKESEKNYIVNLLIRAESNFFILKPNTSNKRILKTNFEEYIKVEAIKEIKYISKGI